MRIAIWLLALLFGAAPAAATPFHHPSGEWREYNQDWLAACPDLINEDATDFYGYSCFASTGSQELNGAGLPAYKLTLVLNRLNGDRDVVITVSPAQGVYDEARPMTLRFGSDPAIALTMGADLETRHNTINQFFVIGDDRDAVLEAMRARNAVTLSVPLDDAEAPVVSRLSLRGVLASLDFMDTYARRVAQY